jgi:hypothetical protein
MLLTGLMVITVDLIASMHNRRVLARRSLRISSFCP